MNWTEGYVAELGYTFGYYPELNPLRSQLAFLAAGVVPPSMGTSCELGFGQGLSINMHAAASGHAWHGTDFNPAQAAFAQELAAVSGANAQLCDAAFAEFCARDDLPDFDSIGLHGIWSWISDDNRKVIADFVRRKLKVGGALYVSYNTLPGWSTFAPIRHLMAEHAEQLGARGAGIVNRINDAIGFADKLLESQPAFLRSNPQAADRLKRVKDQNRSYLAHEYFNRDWHPMYFADMAQSLSGAKVDFVGSAHYLDYIDALNLLPQQQELLKSIPNAQFRQSVRDFMVNQQFRRDYWVKGARRIGGTEQADALRALPVVLTSYRPDVSNKLAGAQGEASMADTLYNPVLDLMADHKVRTIGQMEQALKSSDITFGQVIQAVLALSGSGHMATAQDEKQAAAARGKTDKLNAHLLAKVATSSDVNYLASPVTGGGVAVGRFQQMFICAMREGAQQPSDYAKWVWQSLSAQGQKMLKEGKTLETAEENIAELTSQAALFLERVLPILKALHIA